MTEEHVLVPAMVGLDVIDAQALALAARIVTVTEDPDTPPPQHGTVIAQRPTAGTQVLPGDPVMIWVDESDDDGGGGGGSAPRPVDPNPLEPAGTKPGP
jgi:beta-lactam-binding protein with PASTA domain